MADKLVAINTNVMKVEINHKEITVPEGCVTLRELLDSCGIDGSGRAVAVAGRVVPRAQWEDFHVEDGMRITIIKAVCGG